MFWHIICTEIRVLILGKLHQPSVQEEKNGMSKLRVLLVCGSGASSGFMAANIRKAAAARGLDVDIKARGESEIENYIDSIDVLMIGPHLAYIIKDIKEYVGNTGVLSFVMKPEYYSTLDGEAALGDLLAHVNKGDINE